MININKKPLLFIGIIGIFVTIALLAMLLVPLITYKPEVSDSPFSLTVLEGRADYQKQGAGKWSQVVENLAVNIGDHIRTKHISTAVLSLPDGSKILLEPNTELTVEIFEQEGSSRVARIRLIEGTISADVAKTGSSGSLLEIVSDDSVVAVVGTKLKVEDREGADFSVDLLEGVAHVAHITADEASAVPPSILAKIIDTGFNGSTSLV